MNRTTHEIEPEEVMAYLDGELEASRASEVAAHIAGCAECRSGRGRSAHGVEQTRRVAGRRKLRLPSLNAVEHAIESVQRGEKSSRRSNANSGTWRLVSAPALAHCWKFAATAAVVLSLRTVLLQRTMGLPANGSMKTLAVISRRFRDRHRTACGYLQLYSQLETGATSERAAKSESRTRGSASGAVRLRKACGSDGETSLRPS